VLLVLLTEVLVLAADQHFVEVIVDSCLFINLYTVVHDCQIALGKIAWRDIV
jgi:hypothetical protein